MTPEIPQFALDSVIMSPQNAQTGYINALDYFRVVVAW